MKRCRMLVLGLLVDVVAMPCLAREPLTLAQVKDNAAAERRRACGACGRRGVRAVPGAVGNAERFPRVRQDPQASVAASPGVHDRLLATAASFGFRRGR